MEIDRRHFLTLTTAACALTALQGVAIADTPAAPATNATPSAPAGPQVIDAGPAANYANDGIYSDFRMQGFFLIRKDGNLDAVSSICTHHKQPLAGRPDCTLYCHKHGSIFGADGHVEKGPAKRDLPVFATSVDPATGHLMVTLPFV